MWWRTHRQPDLTGAAVGQLDGDVGGRISRADDQDVAIAERPRVAEVDGMHHLAVELAESGPWRDGGGAIAAGGQYDRRRSDVTLRGVPPPALGCGLDAVDLAAQREPDVLLPDVAVEISDHVLFGRPAAGAERDPLSGKMGQITIGVQPEVVIAVAPRHRWCRGFIDDQRGNSVAVLELARDGKTTRPCSDDND